jgi:hypothetical protein
MGMSSALGITNFAFEATPRLIPDSITIPVLISAYSLSVSATVLSTLIIVIRIVMVSRTPGASKEHHTAVAIVVESAALYSASALVYIPMVLHLSSIQSTEGETYYLYGQLFFTHMAVRLSCLLCLVLAHHFRISPQP